MTQQKHAYGILTGITMIVGIVIGAGIYFKADDILSFTGGNMLLGFLVLVIGASNIIFGSLSLSELAKREDQSGGIIAYLERFSSPGLASAFGWFQGFVFMPSVIAVVAFYCAYFTGQAFGFTMSLEGQSLLAAGYIALFTTTNILSRKLGGYFQNLATAIKLLPFALIATAGLFWVQATPAIPTNYEVVPVHNVGWGWLSALVPLAFAYEGWSFVTSIAHELKNPQRDLVRALIIGPLVILVTYLAFLFGMNQILGASFILSTKDDAISFALSTLLGQGAGKLIMMVVLISVLGVLNGVLLANMRIPQSLAEKNMLHPRQLETIHPRYQLSVASAILVAAITLLWLAVHYFVTVTNLLPKSDVSEIAIVFNYIWYIIVYALVLYLFKKGEIKNRFTGLISPIIAILGAILVLAGSLLNSLGMALVFMAICFLVSLAGYVTYKKWN